MGDEDTPELRRQPQRRNKIIITKCKKPSPRKETKSPNVSKKVNGELSAEKKEEESDSAAKAVTVKITKTSSNTQAKKKQNKGSIKSKKRKLSETSIKSPVEPSDLSNDVLVINENSTKLDAKKSDDADNREDTPAVEFKGFKKRILAQTEKQKDSSSDNSEQKCKEPSSDPQQEAGKSKTKPKSIKNNKAKKKNVAGDGEDGQSDSQAEYAQYLGLQPTMQFKCYRCAERGFPSMLALNMHQRICGISQKSNFISNIQQDTAPSPDPNMLTNFRITRKVYLCSACGTYYENWNLFLHMRDVHKKHICLYCLTMFGIADKLADHLRNLHKVQESTFNSSEEFQNTFKSNSYLVCCSCEIMFNEREDYFNHQCLNKDITAKCNLCGVKCGHYITCPNSSQTRGLPASINFPSIVPTTKGLSITKNTGPVPMNKSSSEVWMGKRGQPIASSDNDDDYDVSHVASFCHVNLSDGEKDKSVVQGDSIHDSKILSINQAEIVESGKTKEQDKDIGERENEANKYDESASAESVAPKEQDDKNKKGNPDESPNANKTNDGLEEGSESINQDKHDALSNNTTLNESEIDTNDKNSMKNNETDATIYNVSDSSSSSDTEDKIETEHVNSIVLPSNKQKDDSTSSDSDSDTEAATHLSASQDDSDSSSDNSSDKELKEGKKGEESAESTKEAEVSEKDHSDNSTSMEDVNSKNLSSENGISVDKNQHETDSILNEEDSLNGSKITVTKQLENVPNDTEPEENDSKGYESDYLGSEKSVQLPTNEINDGIPLANEDIPAMALTLEDKLEVANSQSVVKECVRTSCLNCVYCGHAVKIAVNGKQLALHLLAEHRYKPVKNNETIQDVIVKLKSSMSELETMFFNTDSYDSSNKSLNTPYDYTYECFQCRFVTTVHKELYNHKRKMHQKTVLLCVMCKSNFYSYSELLCHLCPGVYMSEDINFRCCFCNIDNIPSAFRLMVHLRKGHHTCDICLEVAGDQQKLSTHMWKHKLNHLCYRCGIAYRNKPDITKHLFWKHGTESVLCKKCLQKKWPHVYHFCIPPTVFICEECNASFTKAVALKVHKRLHGGELPYGCTRCDKKFVSNKLLRKHEDVHNKPPTSQLHAEEKKELSIDKQNESSDEPINVESIDEPSVENGKDASSVKEIPKENEESGGITESKLKKKKKREKDRKGKHVMDVYDLPPLNLSSESDSSDDDSKPPASETSKDAKDLTEESTAGDKEEHVEKKETNAVENIDLSEENQAPAPVVDGVWDNFHSYKAELEKRESIDPSLPNILPLISAEPKAQPSQSGNLNETNSEKPTEEDLYAPNWALEDHTYCLIPGKQKPSEKEASGIEGEETEMLEAKPASRGHSSSIDHAYATLNSTNPESSVPPDQTLSEQPPTTPPPPTPAATESHSSSKKKQKTPKKKKHTDSSSSSDSSTDSDTTNCSCGPNCSCSSSSSSGSSSSSSDSESSTSEGRLRAASRKEKKKERLKHKHHKEENVSVPEAPPLPPVEEEPIIEDIPEPVEMPIRESDLETNESSTDEDFYDQHPQRHAKQQLEKRNLMLLASVAPVNNGSVSPTPPPPPPPPPQPPLPPPAPKTPPPTINKRKVKTKKRRKSQQSKKSSSKIQFTPSTSLSMPMASSTPSNVLPSHHSLTAKTDLSHRNPNVSFPSDANAGSGSENENARKISKRKRVRNKFYGYSSEEEEQEKLNFKWRKMEPAPQIQSSTPAPSYSFQPSLTIHNKVKSTTQVKRPKQSESSGSEEEIEPSKPKKEISSSSSSSSDSENESDFKDSLKKDQTEKSDNLYCYCQCPYDEVSEMIACDGQDCTIEWFHFECVGIMVPPKGKWYCPDCRKRRDMM